jgi:uncharacterized protein
MQPAGTDPEAQEARLARMVLSGILWSLFGFNALVFLGSELAGFHETLMPAAAGFWLPWWDMNHPMSGVYMAVMLGLGALLLWQHLRLKRVDAAALGMGELKALALIAVAAAVVIDLVAWELIAHLTMSVGPGEAVLGEREDYAYEVSLDHMPGEVLWTIITAPIFEEMTFRGLFLGCLLARGWKPWIAIGVTAAAFASIHGQYYLPGLLSVFVGGLLFGALRVLTGGLAAPILAHMTMNGWVVFTEWAALTGG